MDEQAQLTVYMVAFACEPGRGSEPGVGWVFLRALAEAAADHGWRAVVVTRPHRTEAIATALQQEGYDGVEILAVPVPRLLHLRGARDVRLGSLVWQWRSVSVLRRRMAHDRGPVVVHHVTFATEGVPSFEGRLRRRAALVFGPAGSTDRSADHGLRRRLRRAFARPTLLGTDVLVAQSEQVAEAWRSVARGAVIVEPNVVVEPRERREAYWDVAVVGRLIPRKRVDLALRGLALTGRPLRIAIVGDGPLRAELEALTRTLGMDAEVAFLGSLDRNEALDVLTRTRVLLHTSSQEGAAWVIGEAQAAGAHVVTMRGTGSDDLARWGSSAIVDSADPASVAAGVRSALQSESPGPSTRWSRHRLPGMLTDWYGQAIRAYERTRGTDRH